MEREETPLARYNRLQIEAQIRQAELAAQPLGEVRRPQIQLQSEAVSNTQKSLTLLKVTRELLMPPSGSVCFAFLFLKPWMVPGAVVILLVVFTFIYNRYRKNKILSEGENQ